MPHPAKPSSTARVTDRSLPPSGLRSHARRAELRGRGATRAAEEDQRDEQQPGGEATRHAPTTFLLRKRDLRLTCQADDWVVQRPDVHPPVHQGNAGSWWGAGF